MNPSVSHLTTLNRNTVSGVEVAYDPAALSPDVCAFMAKAEARYVEFGQAWFGNLVETVYPDRQDIRFYVLRRDGEVIAVMPLRVERAAFGQQLYALGNFYTTLFEPLFAPACGPHDMAALLAALRDDMPGLTSLRLAPMDPGSSAYRLVLEGLRAPGWRPFEFFAFGNWYQPVDGSWTDYLAKRNGTLRSTIKRMTKKFDGDGGVMEILTEPQDIGRAIDAYEKVYATSWKKPEPYPEFIPGLLRTCAERGYLRLGLAWLNGRPIAAQLWIVSHGRAEIYKVAYDEGFKAYAPGTLLTAKLMQHVIETDRVAEVDYLIGDDPYKKTWMSHRRERWGVIAYNTRSVGGLAGWAREALGRLIKSLRHRYASARIQTQ